MSDSFARCSPSSKSRRRSSARFTQQGAAPARLECASTGIGNAQIAAIVASYRAQGIPADEIAVLYPRDDRRCVDALCRELRRNHDVCWIANDDDPTGGVRSLSRPGVRLSTIRKAKER